MRTRSISSIIGSSPKNRLSSRRVRNKRPKVPCYCNDCNGKLVLKRTKTIHESNLDNDPPSPPLLNELQEPEIEEDEFQEPEMEPEMEPETEDVRHDSEPETVDSEYIFIPRRRTKRHIIRPQARSELPDKGSELGSESPTGKTSGTETHSEAFAEIFEDYSPPPYRYPDIEDEPTINDRFS